ncbi:MAG: hypothetical protein QS721_09935 [Candidatus Endonucleobacter sp. (ex Gigantidas childressi)]|nr:hypothetical protein [Candidatus Endonucleobacter sp. (ex Gigantidas childressi)]
MVAVKTITSDNGTEFHQYKKVEEVTNCPYHFANPHHSWERGTNESTNDLIRQCLVKGTSMAGLTLDSSRPHDPLHLPSALGCHIFIINHLPLFSDIYE